MRRSKKISVTLTSGVVAVAMAGCSPEQVDISTFTSADQCAAMGNSLDACEASFAAAQENHVQAAPRFESRLDCEAEFGAQNCAPAEQQIAAMTAGEEQSQEQQQQQASGGSFFMPLMLGYMMCSALAPRQAVAAQPLYRTAGGNYTTPAGTNMGRSIGGTQTMARSAVRPATSARTVSRGGFGSNQARGVTSSRGYGSSGMG